MSDPYDSLLDATIGHLESLKKDGVRYLNVQTSTLESLCKPAAAPAKPVPAPASVAKYPEKPETSKPVPPAKPAPAPVMSAKPATAAPFPKKKNNMPLIIAGIVVLLGVVAFFVISGNNKAKAEQAEKERIKLEADAKIKAKNPAGLCRAWE